MKIINQMKLTIKALSVNEGFARATVAAFVASLNPSLDEITDIKTAVSEAVTNCVVHAYPDRAGDIILEVKLINNEVYITVSDSGVGIDDLERAKQPFYTTKRHEERSGMGFTVMESFMDGLSLEHNKGGGLVVRMNKKIGKVNYQFMED